MTAARGPAAALLPAAGPPPKYVERPLIDLRLFRSTGFSAAAGTTFFLSEALFGTLLILPL